MCVKFGEIRTIQSKVKNMNAEQSSKKLKFEFSRLYMTLTFDPSSFRLSRNQDFIICYVCAKFGQIWTIQSKV